jgi:Bacterial regulatory proteins, tetR family
MSVTSTIAANLLVPASLEALLSRSSTRLDHTAMLQRLHAAALLECAIKGYADLKVTDIAERARVSTASIYKTYKDRDEPPWVCRRLINRSYAASFMVARLAK